MVDDYIKLVVNLFVNNKNSTQLLLKKYIYEYENYCVYSIILVEVQNPTLMIIGKNKIDSIIFVLHESQKTKF